MLSVLVVILVVLTFYLLLDSKALAVVAGLVAIPVIMYVDTYNKKHNSVAGGYSYGGGYDALSMGENYYDDYMEGGYEPDDSTMPWMNNEINYSGGAEGKSKGKKMKKSREGDVNQGLLKWFTNFAKEAGVADLSKLDVLELGGRGGKNAFTFADSVKSWTAVVPQANVDRLSALVGDKKITFVAGKMDKNEKFLEIDEIPKELEKKKYDMIFFDNNFHSSADYKKLMEVATSKLNKGGFIFISIPTKERMEKNPVHNESLSDPMRPFDKELTEKKLEQIQSATTFITKNAPNKHANPGNNTWIIKV